MSIETVPGTKIVFAFPGNGYQQDKDYAAQHLTVGAAYTLAKIIVGDWGSRVWLEEAPGKSFNSVMFAVAP